VTKITSKLTSTAEIREATIKREIYKGKRKSQKYFHFRIQKAANPL
jgi:hypothetical protein